MKHAIVKLCRILLSALLILSSLPPLNAETLSLPGESLIIFHPVPFKMGKATMTYTPYGTIGRFFTTYTAADCTDEEVQVVMDMADQPNDVVEIPSCPGGVDWDAGVSWSAPAGAILRGAGNTTVKGGGDETVIVDSWDNGSSGDCLLTITVGGAFRMHSFTIVGGGDATANFKQAVICAFGTTDEFRMDHMHAVFDVAFYADGTTPAWINLWNYIRGVMDNNVQDLLHAGNFLRINYDAYPPGGGEGDGSWAAPTGLGTNDFMYLEDNIQNQPGYAEMHPSGPFGSVDDAIAAESG